MKLEEYLEALRNCPDEIVKFNDSGFNRDLNILTLEFGVYDNFPILLQADYDKVVEHLKNSKGYKFIERSDTKEGRSNSFHYIPGTINLWVYDYPFVDDIYLGEKNKDRDLRKSYNITIMLHTYQEKKIVGVSKEKAMSLVIQDLSNYIIQEKISACFQKSIGWKYKRGFSRMIYHKP